MPLAMVELDDAEYDNDSRIDGECEAVDDE